MPEAAVHAFAETLSPDETGRAERYHSDRDRRRFLAARGQLRALLGQTLNCEPRKIAFGYTAFGKPYVGDDRSPLRFNLSHADDTALAALAWNREVGVDIERVGPEIFLEPLAARFLPPADAAALLSLPPADRSPAFFRAWVRHEAYLKALGTGFTAPSDTPPFDPAHWFCHDLEVGPDYCAAVVVEGQAEPVN